MNANAKYWFYTLLSGEIKEVENDIQNNKLWLNGSANDEIETFKSNISDLIEYRDFLKKTLKNFMEER